MDLHMKRNIHRRHLGSRKYFSILELTDFA